MGVAYSMVQHASLITAPSIKPHAKCQSFSFRYKTYIMIDLIDFWCLTPLSAIFQLYHGDQF
jgi:hypothetical protein